VKTVTANETVWITGSSGFLGSRLSRHFASAGNRVVGLSRRGCAAPHSLKIDLSSPDSIHTLRQLVAKGDGPTILIHAASKQPGSGSLQDFVSSNVQATRNLTDALSYSPPKQLIYTSTQSVYHRPLTIPVREDAPAGGTLPYSATKRWGEQVLEFLGDRTEVIVLRLPSLYGKGQADSFVDGLAKSAAIGERIELFSRGEIVRDALHVSDVVEAIATCVGQTHSAGYVLMNLGCGRAIKTIEYAGAIIDALKSNSEIVLSDRPASHESLYGDIDRARQRIGFRPKTLFESMREYANELRT
jgi:UDP-glucose 4-epimerase